MISTGVDNTVAGMNNYCAVLIVGFALYWAALYSFTNGDVGSGTSGHQPNPLKPALKPRPSFDQDSENYQTLVSGDSNGQSSKKVKGNVKFSPEVKEGSHRRNKEFRTHKNGNRKNSKSKEEENGDLGWTHTTFANNILKNEMSWSTDHGLLLSPVALEVSLAAFFTEVASTELERVVLSLLRVDVMVPKFSPLMRWIRPSSGSFRVSRRRMRAHYSNILQLVSFDSVDIESILYFGEKLSLDEYTAYLLTQYFKTKSYSISRHLKHNGKPVPLLPPELPKYKAKSYILASTLSFRGKWKIKFDPELTRANYFGEKSNELHYTTFISKTDKYYYVEKQDEAYKMIELQFEKHDGPFSLLIFLPYGTNSLLDLQNHLANRDWLQDLDLPETPNTLVHVSVPRFSIRDSWISKDLLTEGANLRSEYVHGIAQSVYFSIDELGAGATSVTTTTPGSENTPPKASDDNSAGGSMVEDPLIITHPPLTFVADRPFMFALVHRTEKIILLLGHVV